MNRITPIYDQRSPREAPENVIRQELPSNFRCLPSPLHASPIEHLHATAQKASKSAPNTPLCWYIRVQYPPLPSHPPDLLTSSSMPFPYPSPSAATAQLPPGDSPASRMGITRAHILRNTHPCPPPSARQPELAPFQAGVDTPGTSSASRNPKSACWPTRYHTGACTEGGGHSIWASVRAHRIIPAVSGLRRGHGCGHTDGHAECA